MIWHPMVWAFWAAAATGSVLYAVAGRCAMDVAANYRPGQADHRQLICERRAEAMTLLGRWALGCLAAAAVIGLIGITRVWHGVIEGAMCGTGVLQAMGVAGSRALVFWAATLLILYGWQTIERLDSVHPETPMVQTGSRLLLIAAPFLTLALAASWQALMRADAAPPVSCCAAVYDRVLNGPAGLSGRSWLPPLALWGSLAGTAILPLAAVLAGRKPHRIPGGMVALGAVGWAVASAMAVKQTWSAYYYQVLSHPCPWCLFLPDYFGAGFFIFGCLAMVPLESLALWAALHTRQTYRPLAPAAERRRRQALRRITVALVGFTLLTVGPALLWRLSTGVWIDGSP